MLFVTVRAFLIT